ncbi:DNA translocase FtsK [Patescibacteria group bacterium]
MAKKKNRKKNKRTGRKFGSKEPRFVLPSEIKKWIGGVLMILIAIILALAFFGRAGVAGKFLMNGLLFLIGKTTFIIPLILVFWGLVFFITHYKRFLWPLFLASLVLILGISGTLETLNISKEAGGYLGSLLVWPLLKLFGLWVTRIIFLAAITIGILIFWQLLRKPKSSEKESLSLSDKVVPAIEKKPAFIKRIFAPKFKVKEIEPSVPLREQSLEKTKKGTITKEIKIKPSTFAYELPPINLLDSEKGAPTSGDTRASSTIIKKTFQNFGIPVEMSEINIGPTVTQYTLKPAEGIRLSRITALSNNLALALASHPIRIEAPIPGRSLVGIEIPNKSRAQVRLRNLIESPNFQNAPSNPTIVLGKDVSGIPVYADLAKMPHMLVAGSTGSGKTIFLNSLILSLLYRNSPEILRLILVDPKRVELSVYNGLPHLLAPVIHGAGKTCNVLKWLVLEMERRFEVLSEAKNRDIHSYNNNIMKGSLDSDSSQGTERLEPMPYIILIIDELADLMAAKGKEVEAGIVRLAQMARAVGIHLVLATQRPSVEVITGLIKANITSRITFQVASQVDSRTVLDMAGAEKLLGAGDMLYLSTDVTRPKRIQGAYISEKEIRKVAKYIKSKAKEQRPEMSQEISENGLARELEKSLEMPEEQVKQSWGTEDVLYEEAKEIVIQARKASASLLQRRLRVGYARAARLIDMLEERGVVGPLDGAKPREVYIEGEEKILDSNEGQELIDY